MKIAVVRQRYVAIGGAERYLKALIDALLARGHEVHLFARAWTDEVTPGLRRHRVPTVGTPGFVRALTFAWSCQQLLLQAGCDVVFSLERTLRQDVYRAGDGCHREWLTRRRHHLPAWRRPFLSLNPLHRTLLALERRTFAPYRTRRVIANSSRGRDEIVRLFGFPADRIDVVLNGVDCRRFCPMASPTARRDVRLLFVGTGFERKGLRFCIEALAQLPVSCRLQVVGKGDPHPHLRRAAQLGVADRVEFLGADVDLAKTYPAADLLVHPAIYEPFANVCLEAMACGLPVVTSRVNGASEVLTHGRDGAIVEDPASIRELAGAIGLFLDPKRRSVASAAARATAEKHPFERNVVETLAVLERVQAERGEQPAALRTDAASSGHP